MALTVTRPGDFTGVSSPRRYSKDRRCLTCERPLSIYNKTKLCGPCELASPNKPKVRIRGRAS